MLNEATMCAILNGKNGEKFKGDFFSHSEWLWEQFLIEQKKLDVATFSGEKKTLWYKLKENFGFNKKAIYVLEYSKMMNHEWLIWYLCRLANII